MELTGKTALVTGGGGGIGLGAALALAREGCRVAISDLDRDRLQRAAAGHAGQAPLLCRACNVTDRGRRRRPGRLGRRATRPAGHRRP